MAQIFSTQIQGYDGVAYSDVLLESATNPNIRAALYSAGNKLSDLQANADAIAATSRGLATVGFLVGYNGVTWDRVRTENTGQLMTSMRINNVVPQLDATDEIAVSIYGKNTAAGDMPVKVDENGYLQVDVVTGLSLDTELETDDLDTGAGTDMNAIIGLALAESGGHLLVGSANPLPVSDNGGALSIDVGGTVPQLDNTDEIAASVYAKGNVAGDTPLTMSSSSFPNLRVSLWSADSDAWIETNAADGVAAARNSLLTKTFLYGFNGTTWDRLHVESATQPALITGISQGGNQAGVVQANADAVVATGYGLATRGMLYGYNGTAWDRLKVESATNSNLRVGIFEAALQVNVVDVDNYDGKDVNGLPTASILYLWDPENNAGFMAYGFDRVALLSAVGTVGPGTAHAVKRPFGSHHTWQITVTGAPSAVQVDLEGSLDGTDWYSLDSSTTTTGEMRFVVGKPTEYIRGNLVTLTGGTNPTVTLEWLATMN